MADDIEETSAEWEVLEGGYAIPRRFWARMDVHKGGPTDPTGVAIDVEVHDGRARAREVRVKSDRPLGVGSGTLRGIPVREVVAFRARHYLHRIEFNEHGEPTKVPVSLDDEKAWAVIQTLVGYVVDAELFREEGVTP